MLPVLGGVWIHFLNLRAADCAELRPEALCALTNIASTECTKAVAMEPATLPALVELLSSSDLYLREQVGATVRYPTTLCCARSRRLLGTVVDCQPKVAQNSEPFPLLLGDKYSFAQDLMFDVFVLVGLGTLFLGGQCPFVGGCIISDALCSLPTPYPHPTRTIFNHI